MCKLRVSEYWHNHVKGLAVQGKMLELVAMEANNAHWKSIAFNLPKRVAKVMSNAHKRRKWGGGQNAFLPPPPPPPQKIKEKREKEKNTIYKLRLVYYNV